jgi:hypothetical protein
MARGRRTLPGPSPCRYCGTVVTPWRVATAVATHTNGTCGQTLDPWPEKSDETSGHNKVSYPRFANDISSRCSGCSRTWPQYLRIGSLCIHAFRQDSCRVSGGRSPETAVYIAIPCPPQTKDNPWFFHSMQPVLRLIMCSLSRSISTDGLENRTKI